LLPEFDEVSADPTPLENHREIIAALKAIIFSVTDLEPGHHSCANRGTAGIHAEAV
jgi:hypothetical protein